MKNKKNMFKEIELVDFETAKLASELGFDDITNSGIFLYHDSGNVKYDSTFSYKNSIRTYNEFYDSYSAPTQSQLCRWLREEHKISISIETGWLGGNFIYEVYVWKEHKDYWFKECFEVFEKAMEFGLIEGLKLVNEKNVT